MSRFLPLLFCLAFTTRAGEWPEAKRIVFLGDSITQGGRYLEMVDAGMILAHPDRVVEVIPVGLASETVSGLSEDGHAGGKFPRPDLHERLDRVLAKAKPDLVVACYGINCGIYQPFSEERFAAFKGGMSKLHDKAVEAGAKVVHLTPPVYDRGAKSKAEFDYDEVLARYSQWLLSQRAAAGWTVYDIHGPMRAALDAGRQADPAFKLAGDGIHPGEEGHALMAAPLFEAWGLPGKPGELAKNPRTAAVLALVARKHGLLRPAWLSEIGHKRPGVAKGLPLAEALAKAGDLDAQARAAAKAAP